MRPGLSSMCSYLQIEAAYDILFMHSMRRRLSGQGVRESVRFADVARRKPAKQVRPGCFTLAGSLCMAAFQCLRSVQKSLM